MSVRYVILSFPNAHIVLYCSGTSWYCNSVCLICFFFCSVGWSCEGRQSEPNISESVILVYFWHHFWTGPCKMTPHHLWLLAWNARPEVSPPLSWPWKHLHRWNDIKKFLKNDEGLLLRAGNVHFKCACIKGQSSQWWHCLLVAGVSETSCSLRTARAINTHSHKLR